MKKVIVIFLILLTLIGGGAFLVWLNLSTIVAGYLSRHLNHVPVKLDSISYHEDAFYLYKLHIKNPPKSKTETAFKTDVIEIDATFNELRAKELTIEEIELDNILINVEYYNREKTKTNWGYILKSSGEKGSDKPYLIKKLTLKNLTVMTTDHKGEKTVYPTLDKLEFYNISNETGFPIEEIEKAIFQIMLQKALQEFGIKTLKEVIDRFVPNLPGVFGN